MYKKQSVIGCADLFDTISGFFKRLFTSNAAKQVASTAFSVGKDAARQIGKYALDVSKTAAIDAGKRLVGKAALLFTLKFTPEITQKSKDMLESLIDDYGVNINNLLASSSGKSKTMAIQGLVRRLNGWGLKFA